MEQSRASRAPRYIYGALGLPLLIMACITIAWLGRAWWIQKQWFSLQQEQMATIMRLQSLPPDANRRDEWREVIVMLHNVWGNVTFAPSYSEITNAEMEALQRRLTEIVEATTPENSIDSVDRIYGILMPI